MAIENIDTIRIGIPKVLNSYCIAPFLMGYLEALGVRRRHITWSDDTSEEMFLEGGKYGSVDPCFPAKITLAHVHNLMYRKQIRRKLNYIWFPSVTDIPNFLTHTMGSAACPIVAGTPMVAKAAFTKEKDFFKETGVEYIDLPLNFQNKDVLENNLYRVWGDRLSLTKKENEHACEEGMKALKNSEKTSQEQGRKILDDVEKNNKLAILMLGRPYHNDPGINHEILNEFQAMGYPILTIKSIPKDPEYLERFFKQDLQDGVIEDVFDIRDVWVENYSANAAQKVWAAKFAARHPHVAVVDLSSFKCGMDAPTYGLIDNIIGATNTPYIAFHDLDSNKPTGSIKIRALTYEYTLKRYQEYLDDVRSGVIAA